MQRQYLTRRKFVKVAAVAGGTAAMGGLVACATDTSASSAGSQAASSSAASSAEGSAASSLVDAPDSTAASSEFGAVSSEADAAASNDSTGSDKEEDMPTGNALVLVYSRAGENYNVGTIEVGNTMVLAQFVQQKTGADLFELVPAEPYPDNYDACCDQALAEQHAGARPALEALPDLASYSTVYFGFPVWWEDIPMPVYTAIEALDWQGKTIAPFNTHEGSGNAGMFATLADVCAGATVLDGLTMQGGMAQNQRDVAEQRVDEWLEGLGL